MTRARPTSGGASRSPSGRPAVPQLRPPARVRPPVHWPRSLLILVALLSAYAGMHVVLQDLSWWWVGGTLRGPGAGVDARSPGSSRPPRWIPPLVAIGVCVLGVTIGFGGDTPFLGILPTFETGDHLNQVINSGWQSIAEQRVPATARAGHRAAAGVPDDRLRAVRRRRDLGHRVAGPGGSAAAHDPRRSRSRCAPTSPTRSGTSSPPSCSSSSCDSGDGRPRPPVLGLVGAIVIGGEPAHADVPAAGGGGSRSDRRRRRDRHQPADQPRRRSASRRSGHRPDLHDDRRCRAVPASRDARHVQRPHLVADPRRGGPRQHGRRVPAADGTRDPTSPATCSPPTSRSATSRAAGCRCRTRARP